MKNFIAKIYVKCIFSCIIFVSLVGLECRVKKWLLEKLQVTTSMLRVLLTPSVKLGNLILQ